MTKTDWKKCKLGDVCYPVSETYNFSNREKVVFINTGDISFGKFLKKEYEPVVSLPGQAKKSIQKNDILFSEIRPANGRFALVDFDAQDFVVSTKLMVLRSRQIIDLKFLYLLLTNKYTLAEFQHIAESRSGTFPQITFDAISYFPISLPPLDEQKRIAEVLGAFDDKIELLQKQNKTLEDMAKALFKSWFVDFDVVHAKQKGLPKADIMREYHLTEELYDLFPFSFADSPLGPIPSGWEVKPLSKIATFLNGLALQKYPARAEEDFLPVIKIAELRNGISTSTDKANTNLPTEYIVHNGDILFSWSGSLMVKVWSGEKGALNQHLFKVLSNGYPKWFYYLWVNHYLPMFQEIAADKATTMGHIQRKHLDQAKVVCPSAAFLDKMDKIFGVILSKIILNNKQIQTLTELRDSLLPRLISGKIRV